MNIGIHASFLPQDDQDASPVFYRDTPGLGRTGFATVPSAISRAT
jgi:hypothetical protein